MEAVMRFTLRMLALLVGASVIFTIIPVARAGSAGVAKLAASGTFGIVTIVAWAITVVVGSFAAIQLLRLKNSGRLAAAFVFALMAIYYLAGAFVFRDPGEPWVPIAITAALAAACMVMLLLPMAKYVCTDLDAAIDGEWEEVRPASHDTAVPRDNPKI